MSRAYCISGVLFLFCAFVLLFLVSISLPYFQAMDITRVHATGQFSSGSQTITELRLGIWGYCIDENSGRTCYNTGHGYSLTLQNSQGGQVTIGSSWTRGLAVHPVATALAFIALVMSFSQHITITLVSSLVYFLTALLTGIAFAIDIVLYAYVTYEMGNLTSNESIITRPGPGW
ncbi:hypothetical protein AZE42_04948 [Rhizopogon vesiculosus]|uniref:Pali-domain-containing protein n=1 Tax=Rhizopogon vesiculosus TaxID=180088 RepID=A0A1J8QLD5_9AGAM|nr:hypothetical protein AZE42_04948 [Rhizopogon vesiculosus]